MEKKIPEARVTAQWGARESPCQVQTRVGISDIPEGAQHHEERAPSAEPRVSPDVAPKQAKHHVADNHTGIQVGKTPPFPAFWRLSGLRCIAGLTQGRERGGGPGRYGRGTRSATDGEARDALMGEPRCNLGGS